MRSFSTETGDTFVALIRRVYDIHEHERVCQVALIVARLSNRNKTALKDRIHVALPAGLVLDFPEWPQVAAQLAVVEENRKAAIAHASQRPKMSGLAPPTAKLHTIALPKSPKSVSCDQLDEACRAEYARRFRLLRLALDAGLPLSGTSEAIDGGTEEVIETLRRAPDTPAVTPKIRAAIAAVWSRPDLAGCAPASGVARFIDTFDEEHKDGTLQAALLAASAGGEAQQLAMRRAVELLALVTVPATGTPSADIGACLGDFLRIVRTRRAQRSRDEQERELAEERRLLAGRNYTTYRKDVNAAIDARLALAQNLSPMQRRVVYFSFLCSTGHRLAGMSREQIDEALEKLISVARSDA
jgi:hypothetical protein